MANIGNLAVTLSLDAALFASGLDKSTAQGRKFASDITSTFAGIGAGFAGIQGIGDIGRGAFEGIKTQTDNMAALGRQAKELGLSLREIAAVNLLAAGDTGGMTTALTHMSAELGKAAREGGEAAPFKALHLNVSRLMDLSPADRIGEITTALNGLGNINQKIDLGRSIFGRGGLDAADKLGEGLDGALGKVDKHGGIGFSPEDLKLAKDVQQSIGEAEAGFGKIGMAAVTEFGPAIKGAADLIADLAGSKLPAIRQEFKAGALAFVDGLDIAIKDVRTLVLIGSDLEKTYGNIFYYATYLDRPPSEALGDFAKWLGNVKPDSMNAFEKDFTGGIDKILAATAKMREEIGKPISFGKPALDAGLHEDKSQDADAPGGGSWADIVALGDKFDALNLKIHDQIGAFGMGADAMERYKLATLGADDAQLKIIDTSMAQLQTMTKLTEETGRGATIFQQTGSKMADTFAALKNGSITFGESLSVLGKQFEQFHTKLDADFNGIVEAARSPLAKLGDQMENLRYLRDFGDSKGNKLTGDQFASALGKDFLSLSPFTAAEHAPGALMQGSMEAYGADVRFQREANGGGGDIQEQIKATIERMAETGKQHLQVARQIAQLLPDLLQGQGIEQ